MPKKSPKPLDKRIVNFVQGDIETLESFYAALGYGPAIREIIHQHCNNLRERASREGVQGRVRTAPDVTSLIDSIRTDGELVGPSLGDVDG